MARLGPSDMPPHLSIYTAAFFSGDSSDFCCSEFCTVLETPNIRARKYRSYL